MAAAPLSGPKYSLLLSPARRTDLVELILDLGAAADLDDRVDDVRARGPVLNFV